MVQQGICGCVIADILEFALIFWVHFIQGKSAAHVGQDELQIRIFLHQSGYRGQTGKVPARIGMSHRFPAVDAYGKTIVLCAFQNIYKIRILKIISISPGAKFAYAGKAKLGTPFNFGDGFSRNLGLMERKPFSLLG